MGNQVTMAESSGLSNGVPRGVVVVGASAGGVEALTRFAGGLPADFSYSILVTLHMPASAPSVLGKIIDRHAPLPASTAIDGEPLQAGHIYVAVPDRHLLLSDHRVVLSEGPTENSHRPAINSLFRSAALHFGQYAIGVVFSGVLDDGVLGAAAIRSRGGITVAQRPDDALFATMPNNAIEAGVIDHQVAAADAGTLIKQLTERDIEEREMERDISMELENRIAMGRKYSTAFDSEELGPPSGYTCPDCNGSLMTLSEKSFRCRVGHAWTAEALLNARDAEVENALWIALRSLQEKARMTRRLAENVGSGRLSARYARLAEEAEEAVTVLGRRLAEPMRPTSGTVERGG